MHAAMSYIYIYVYFLFVCLLACFWQTIAGAWLQAKQSLTKDVMESDRQMALLTPSPLSGISQNCDHERLRLEHTCQVIFHKELCVVSLHLHGFLPPVCRYRLSIKEMDLIPRYHMVAGSCLSDVQFFAHVTNKVC